MGIIEGLRDVHVIQLCLFNLTVDVYYVLGDHLFCINCILFIIILSPSPTKTRGTPVASSVCLVA